jgi:hypothetical protein
MSDRAFMVVSGFVGVVCVLIAVVIGASLAILTAK